MEVQLSLINNKILYTLWENGQLIKHFNENITSMTGLIVKGKVVRVVPALNCAFIDIGVTDNAFMSIKPNSLSTDNIYVSTYKSKRSGLYLEQGDIFLCQIIKDIRGDKGYTVSNKIKISGICIDYYPFGEGIKFSNFKKTQGEKDKLFNCFINIIEESEGIVIKENANSVDKEVLVKELDSLRLIWKDIINQYDKAEIGAVLNADERNNSSIDVDLMSETIDAISFNDNNTLQQFIKKHSLLYKKLSEKKIIKTDRNALVDKYLNDRVIELDNGGNIVIDYTEALVVIDVNSGTDVHCDSAESMFFNSNILAAQLILKIIELRDITGIIIIDFINLSIKTHKNELLNYLNNNKSDNVKVEGITKLGLVEMTRKAF